MNPLMNPSNDLLVIIRNLLVVIGIFLVQCIVTIMITGSISDSGTAADLAIILIIFLLFIVSYSSLISKGRSRKMQQCFNLLKIMVATLLVFIIFPQPEASFSHKIVDILAVNMVLIIVVYVYKEVKACLSSENTEDRC